MDTINEFALTTQILDPAYMQIVLFTYRPTFDEILTEWKKYRSLTYVIDQYGESHNAINEECDPKYMELFDNLTLNDDHTAKYWLCIVFESGDEIIFTRDGESPDFTVLNCKFSNMIGYESRNRLSRVRNDAPGEYLVALLHK